MPNLGLLLEKQEPNWSLLYLAEISFSVVFYFLQIEYIVKCFLVVHSITLFVLLKTGWLTSHGMIYWAKTKAPACNMCCVSDQVIKANSFTRISVSSVNYCHTTCVNSPGVDLMGDQLLYSMPSTSSLATGFKHYATPEQVSGTIHDLLRLEQGSDTSVLITRFLPTDTGRYLGFTWKL